MYKSEAVLMDTRSCC